MKNYILITSLTALFLSSVSLGHHTQGSTGQDQKKEKKKELQVPYAKQGENYYEPGSTCGLTSASMILNYYLTRDRAEKKISETEFLQRRRNITPDRLYKKYGKRHGQSPEMLAKLYEKEGLYGVYSRYGTKQDIIKQLDMERPVIMHGWFSKNGHILVLTGYNNSGFIVNDPAGDWVRCYKCGWKKQSSGHKKVYTFNQLNNSVLGKEGNIWYSYARPKN